MEIDNMEDMELKTKRPTPLEEYAGKFTEEKEEKALVGFGEVALRSVEEDGPIYWSVPLINRETGEVINIFYMDCSDEAEAKVLAKELKPKLAEILVPEYVMED